MNTQNTTETQNAKTPIAINTVVMHEQPHLDEVVAYVILTAYGEGLFPGISKVPYRFMIQDIPGTETEWDSEGILPVGIGQGRFDEHRKGISGDRIKGDCAATLVAKYLGVQANPELKRLLAETLEGDEKATNTPTQIAELMKVSYRHLQTDSQKVFQMMVTAVRAIIKQQKFPFAALASEKPLKTLWKTALDADDELKAQQKVVSRIGQLIGGSILRKEHFVTEFSSVIEALFRVPYSFEEVIAPQFEFFLAAIKNDTVEYQAVMEELKKVPPVEVRVCNGKSEWKVNMLACTTDVRQAPKVGRSLGYPIVLVRNSKGNFQIFTDNNMFADGTLSVANIVRMLRWLLLTPEQQKEISRPAKPGQKDKLTWQSLGAAGEHPAVPGLYYHASAENVYNGSTTHTAKPLGICSQAIIEVIKYGLHPRYMKMWCYDRGIMMHPERIARSDAGCSNVPAANEHLWNSDPGTTLVELEEVLDQKIPKAQAP